MSRTQDGGFVDGIKFACDVKPGCKMIPKTVQKFHVTLFNIYGLFI